MSLHFVLTVDPPFFVQTLGVNAVDDINDSEVASLVKIHILYVVESLVDEADTPALRLFRSMEINTVNFVPFLIKINILSNRNVLKQWTNPSYKGAGLLLLLVEQADSLDSFVVDVVGNGNTQGVRQVGDEILDFFILLYIYELDIGLQFVQKLYRKSLFICFM